MEIKLLYNKNLPSTESAIELYGLGTSFTSKVLVKQIFLKNLIIDNPASVSLKTINGADTGELYIGEIEPDATVVLDTFLVLESGMELHAFGSDVNMIMSGVVI